MVHRAHQSILGFSKPIHIHLNACWFTRDLTFFIHITTHIFACISYSPANFLTNRDLNSNIAVVGIIDKNKT